MGGTSRLDTDDLDNLIALDPVVHNGGPASVHGRRTWSEERGYLLPKNLDEPGRTPLLQWGTRWVELRKDGRVTPWT